MNKIFLLILALINIWSSSIFACSCDFRTDHGNADKPVSSMGTGYRYIKNGKLYFKFISCINREACRDLLLSSEVNKKEPLNYEDIHSLGFIETIYTHFKSFEDAINYDKFENLKRSAMEKLRDLISQKSIFDSCRCPIIKTASILSGPDNIVVESILTRYKIEFNPEFKNCDACDRVSELINIDSESYNLYGNFFLKDNQLYFNSKSQRDSRVVKIKQNFKCSPSLKDNLNQDIRLTSKYKFNISNETIGEINFCKVRVVYNDTNLPFSTFSEEEYLNKIFPTDKKCKSPIFDENFLKKAKKIILAEYVQDPYNKKLIHYVRTMDLLNNAKIENVLVTDYTGEENQFSGAWIAKRYALVSTDNIKITKNNATKINNFCNTVILAEGFNDYDKLKKKFEVKINKANNKYFAKIREVEEKSYQKTLKEIQKRQQENAWRFLERRDKRIIQRPYVPGLK